ncbi:hypothetical protein H6P81_005807 [Aristolochia fimbriata]|uniref:Peptidase A1 domain-containing protein n=1 Tax=Aristolochia fimbriata TaxID=158543 RepID=A0AAV7EVP7_ARIFI|nr:hypothetical protein H6P81_005807 [Aristolochia fimbriata]
MAALPNGACSVVYVFFFFFFFFFFSDLCAVAVTAGGSNGGGYLSVKLFHRDSPLSPLHDPSLTPRGRVERDLRLSKARGEYFTSASKLIIGRSGRRERSEVGSIGGNYIMSYSLGTPPVKLVGIFDTGSDLTWTQCKPCLSCFTQNDPLFDPAASSSYGLLTCDSPDCKQISTCTGTGVCDYTYSYAYSYTRGTFATDTVTLESADGSVFSRRVRFGCANNNSVHFDRRMDGIVGLGGGPLSLVRQLGFHWFAYCMVPFEDSTSAGTITFGGGGGGGGGRVGAGVVGQVAGVVSTPLFNEPHDETFYTLNLNRIVVGNNRDIIDLPAEDRDIIVDTGTPHILLNTTVHDRLVASYAAAAAGIPTVKDDPSGFKLCYEARYGSQLPDVTFGFTGADLRLGAEKNLLVRGATNGVVCLGVVVNEGISIFGAVATQNFKVGIDLIRKSVTFAPADCTKTT